VKIVKLAAENFKRLSAVEITPEGNVVEIRGDNGNGKSSVLDSIAAALGGERLCPREPIRKGEDHAQVSVELDSGLVATRHWTEKGSRIEVTAKDGAKYPKPQAVLDALTNGLSFDPLSFLSKKPAEQLQVLRDLAGVKLDDLAEQHKATFAERTVVNREMDRLTAQIPPPVAGAEIPEKEESVQSVLAELDAARRAKADNDLVRADLAKARADYDAMAKRLAELKETGKTLATKAKDLKDPDLAGLEFKATRLEARNELVRATRKRDETIAAAEAKKKESAALTAKLEALQKAKLERIAAAKMPVEGLGFGEDGITLNGLPFDQAGGAERLRVSLAMGLALNPALKVLLIRDGSLIGPKQMAIVAEMAAKADAQVWVEIVDASKTVGIVIEDGRVLGAPAPAPAEPKPTKKKAPPAAEDQSLHATQFQPVPAAGSAPVEAAGDDDIAGKPCPF
jgi:hypothetical protein